MWQLFGRQSAIGMAFILLGAILSLPERADAGPIAFCEPVNVTETNSPYIDRDPALSADGFEIFFTSDRPGSVGDWDIWRATRQDTHSSFGVPVNVPVINTIQREANPCLSSDGLSLYFSLETGSVDNLGIYVSTRASRSSDFSTTRLMTELRSSDYLYCGSDPSISADGLTLYFSPRVGPYDEDLFFSRRANLNTPFGPGTRIAELSTSRYDRDPWVSADERLMFFASDRVEQFHFQIYVSSRLSPGNTWGTPHLVEGVNAGYGEGVPFFDEGRQLLYFASARPGGLGGALDIWAAQAVPEPASLAFLGFVALVVRARRRLTGAAGNPV